MARYKNDSLPVITELNKWLASKFLEYIGTIYDEYFNNFVKVLHWPEDKIQDTLLRVYQSILYNGLQKPIFVDKETPEDIRNDIFRYKFFISCKSNCTNLQSSDYYDTHRDGNDIFHTLRNEESISSEEKVKKDLLDDFKTLKTLEYVENNFEPIDYHLFRLYYILPKMTYKKLQELTGKKDARTRVVRIAKHLREIKTELETNIKKEFEEKYGDLESYT